MRRRLHGSRLVEFCLAQLLGQLVGLAQLRVLSRNVTDVGDQPTLLRISQWLVLVGHPTAIPSSPPRLSPSFPAPRGSAVRPRRSLRAPHNPHPSQNPALLPRQPCQQTDADRTQWIIDYLQRKRVTAAIYVYYTVITFTVYFTLLLRPRPEFYEVMASVGAAGMVSTHSQR